MASLGRFIPVLYCERALPFFKIMKRTGTFKWTPEAEKDFEDLKSHSTYRQCRPSGGKRRACPPQEECNHSKAKTA